MSILIALICKICFHIKKLIVCRSATKQTTNRTLRPIFAYLQAFTQWPMAKMARRPCCSNCRVFDINVYFSLAFVISPFIKFRTRPARTCSSRGIQSAFSATKPCLAGVPADQKIHGRNGLAAFWPLSLSDLPWAYKLRFNDRVVVGGR